MTTGKPFQDLLVGEYSVDPAFKPVARPTVHGKTGVLDYTFDRYLTDAAPQGISFTQWVESPDYDPVKIKADFRAGMIGGIVTEGILKRE